jgi:hypothetical protein
MRHHYDLIILCEVGFCIVGACAQSKKGMIKKELFHSEICFLKIQVKGMLYGIHSVAKLVDIL